MGRLVLFMLLEKVKGGEEKMKFTEFKLLTKKAMIEWLQSHEYTMACFDSEEEE